MKKLVILFVTLLMVACQDGGSPNGGNTLVANPLGMSCINGNAYCNNAPYAQTNGWMPYPGAYNYAYDYTNTFNTYGLCNCPSGYLPTLNGSYGLGCVSTQLLDIYSGAYFYWQWSFSGAAIPAPQATTNFPQFSNIPGNSNSASACSRTLTQSCLLDQGNTCAAGATCRQVILGSNLGVCVRY